MWPTAYYFYQQLPHIKMKPVVKAARPGVGKTPRVNRAVLRIVTEGLGEYMTVNLLWS